METFEYRKKCDWQCFDHLLDTRMIWPCICNKIGEMQWKQLEFASKNVSSDPDVRKRRHLHEPLLHCLYEIIIEMRGIGRLLNLCQIQTSNVEFSLISLPDHPFCLIFWILNKNSLKNFVNEDGGTGARPGGGPLTVGGNGDGVHFALGNGIGGGARGKTPASYATEASSRQTQHRHS